MTMDEVTRKRLDRIEYATDMTPADLLRMALDDIERGEIPCDGVIVIYCNRPPASQGDWKCGTYRAGLTRDAELVQIELAKQRCLRSWLDQ